MNLNVVVTLRQLNALSNSDANAFFLGVCHCKRWAMDMVRARPFTSVDQVQSVADRYWQEACEAEILESFQGHARIGDLSAMRKKYSAASKEQGQVAAANEALLHSLFDKNKEYFDKHGFIFIVCATGKSAQEMLDLLLNRLNNTRQEELKNGFLEQGKISTLRLSSRITA